MAAAKAPAKVYTEEEYGELASKNKELTRLNALLQRQLSQYKSHLGRLETQNEALQRLVTEQKIQIR